MSDNLAIKVENLSKCYQIYDQPRDRLKQMLLPHLQRAVGVVPKQYYREFWALKNVSFEVKKGETVGIIGRNGSGKSTLLQVICGTLNPTAGDAKVTGRIAALLELGSGFNPEFTGRENVYLNAAVLGLSLDEIDARFDDIVEFADIGDFIEQPVKTYSSGMMVRLAFSVAINVQPDILIIDEALAVGDELFQRKCFARIEVIRRTGATILFVSHSGAQIVELCDRAILMDAGERIAIGSPKKIVGQYQKLLYAPPDARSMIRMEIRDAGLRDDQLMISDSSAALGLHSPCTESVADLQEYFDPKLRPSSTIEYESNGASIEGPMILDLSGNPVNHLVRGRTYRFVYGVRFSQAASTVRFGMMIKTISGMELGGGTSAVHLKDSIPLVSSEDLFRVDFSFCCLLNTGTYFINAGVMGDVRGSDGFIHRLVDVAIFKVQPENNTLSTGIVDFSCVPDIKKVKAIV